MYSFFQSCTNSVVLIYIFLKSCTTIKKLYNQRKKLYIFGTLSLPLNFIHNGVCTKMYSFFQSCTNAVVLIYIFLKSCTTIKKLYNQRKNCTFLVHCLCLLISQWCLYQNLQFFPKLYKFCGPHIYIFKKLYNH